MSTKSIKRSLSRSSTSSPQAYEQFSRTNSHRLPLVVYDAPIKTLFASVAPSTFTNSSEAYIMLSPSSLRSLGFRSDLLLISLQGEIVAHEDVIQAITPHNPDYYWGNFLVFPQAPSEADVEGWPQRFHELFSTYEGVKHIAFGWDGIDGQKGHVQPWLDQGYILEELSVMTANATQLCSPPHLHPTVEVRPLHTDQDWAAATALQIQCGLEFYTSAEYSDFKRTQMHSYRTLTQRGHGHWYGAFLKETLVADLGLFHGDGIGRFQSVETHPDYRRQGFCRTLVYEASRHSLAQHPSHTLVIVANTDAPAMRVYADVGYTSTERQLAMFKRPDGVGPRPRQDT